MEDRKAPVRMCVGCQDVTEYPVRIRTGEQCSGPGWSIYACPDCAPRYLTVLQAWEALWNHVVYCPVCARTGWAPAPAETDGEPTASVCDMGRALIRVHRSTFRRQAVAEAKRVT